MSAQRLTREESRRRTREQLLDAAAEVFSRRGYHNASVDEVAEAAGFSKGAVYSNFTSKEDLFLALLDRHLDQVVGGWERFGSDRHAGQGDAADGATGRRSFVEELDRERVWNLLLLEFFLYAMRDDRIREKVAARYRSVRETIARLLRRQFSDAAVPPPLPIEHLAWVVSSLGSGLAVQAYLDPRALPATVYEDTIDFLVSGMARPARTEE